MKKLMFLAMMFGVLFVCNQSVSAQRCIPDDNQIAVFQDWRLEGNCKILNIGTYSQPISFENDWISSIKIGKNVKIKICSNAEFKGTCQEFESDIDFLGTTKVGNDSVSSIEVSSKLQNQVNSPGKLFERVAVQNYELRWNDAGSGNKKDLALWHPIAPPGYFVIGSFGLSDNKADLSDATYDYAYAYRPLTRFDVGGQLFDSIVHPRDYKLLWKDKGSGARMNGSIWSPICPERYVAMGIVAQPGYDKPSTRDVGCIFDDTLLLEKQTPDINNIWFSSQVNSLHLPFMGVDHVAVITYDFGVGDKVLEVMDVSGYNKDIKLNESMFTPNEMWFISASAYK